MWLNYCGSIKAKGRYSKSKHRDLTSMNISWENTWFLSGMNREDVAEKVVPPSKLEDGGEISVRKVWPTIVIIQSNCMSDISAIEECSIFKYLRI